MQTASPTRRPTPAAVSYTPLFSGLTFKTSLILSVNDLYYEGDVIDAARDWQEDYLPCVCHRGGQGEDDRWEYEPAEDYRPFTRPADIPKSIFDKLCASQGTTIEKVVNDPVKMCIRDRPQPRCRPPRWSPR